jgi:zinc-ribbon
MSSAILAAAAAAARTAPSHFCHACNLHVHVLPLEGVSDELHCSECGDNFVEELERDQTGLMDFVAARMLGDEDENTDASAQGPAMPGPLQQMIDELIGSFSPAGAGAGAGGQWRQHPDGTSSYSFSSTTDGGSFQQMYPALFGMGGGVGRPGMAYGDYAPEDITVLIEQLMQNDPNRVRTHTVTYVVHISQPNQTPPLFIACVSMHYQP